MNCYFTCQKLSNFSNACFTTTKEIALAPFSLAHPVDRRTAWARETLTRRKIRKPDLRTELMPVLKAQYALWALPVSHRTGRHNYRYQVPL